MIYILLGTKGQLIKMAPVMRELQKRDIDYIFIHTGQHTQITKDIMDTFKLKHPDFYLSCLDEDVVDLKTGIYLAITTSLKSLKIKKTCFFNKSKKSPVYEGCAVYEVKCFFIFSHVFNCELWIMKNTKR